jgi:hypothetical protein
MEPAGCAGSSMRLALDHPEADEDQRAPDKRERGELLAEHQRPWDDTADRHQQREGAGPPGTHPPQRIVEDRPRELAANAS